MGLRPSPSPVTVPVCVCTAQEEAIRHWATVLSVRLDLDAARGKLGPEACEMERQRFDGVIAMMERNDGPTLVVTDSQVRRELHRGWRVGTGRRRRTRCS